MERRLAFAEAENDLNPTRLGDFVNARLRQPFLILLVALATLAAGACGYEAPIHVRIQNDTRGDVELRRCSDGQACATFGTHVILTPGNYVFADVSDHRDPVWWRAYDGSGATIGCLPLLYANASKNKLLPVSAATNCSDAVP